MGSLDVVQRRTLKDYNLSVCILVSLKKPPARVGFIALRILLEKRRFARSSIVLNENE